MASSSEIFNQVRAAVDIVEVIGEHVALKRAGREFKGLCPFHEDHRPSMAVVPHKQIFHCFVCGTGGDVFKFIKEFHKMGNGEALRMLAQRAGIKLPELPPRGGYRGGGGVDRDKDGLSPRERIANTNEWACAFFEKHLRTPQGKAGLDYFRSRGLTDETMAKFRLGMSPDGFTGLVNSAMRLGVSTEALGEAGLIKQRPDSSPYDAFRNRVMFPIIDATGGGGRVIAFGGRILVEKRDEAGNVIEAKYLNSPETRLFNKSESLYGLNLARQQIIRTRTAVVVEGYMDVIACHQAGVTNVIAALGTAFTPEHARILRNYAQTIVLVFDSDDAGRRATDRALEVFVRGTLDVKLASVPDGKDPCDFCMKNGGEPFQKLIDNATDALTYKWQTLLKQFHGTNSVTARQEAITTYLRFIAPLFESNTMDPIRRGLLLSKTAALVGIKSPELEPMLRKLSQQAMTQFRPPTTVPAQAAPPAGANFAGREAPFTAMAVPEAPVRPNIRQLKGLAAAEGWLLGALLVKPTLYDTVREHLSLGLFEVFRPLATVVIEYLENAADLAECTLADLTATLEEQGAGGGADPRTKELVRQAIELEGRTADWLEPSNLSPVHAKLVQQCADDRGLSLEMLVGDSLKELQAVRGTVDPNVAADFGEEQATVPPPSKSGESQLAKDFDEIKKLTARNASGGNPRITGF
jgi:DNA primase